MKVFVLSCLLICYSVLVSAQYTYKIKADSVKITNDSCTAELILENSTRQVDGFLYNKGNGRTEFRKPAVRMGDSVFFIGADTLNLGASAGLGNVGNGINSNGDSLQLGGNLERPTKINMWQNSLVFNISDDSTAKRKGDVRIRGVRDTISTWNNLYIEHYQKGARFTGDPTGAGSVYAETWYQTSDTFNNGAFATYVSRQKQKWGYAPNMENARLFGFRSFLETHKTGYYGVFTHFQAQHVYGDSGHINTIYGLRLNYLKGPNTTHAYAISTEGAQDSIVFAGPLRIAKYKNIGSADSVLSVDSIGNIVLRPGGGSVKTNVQELTDASTVVWDIDDGINAHIILRGDNRTLDIQNPIVGYTYKLRVEQDSTGGREIYEWPSGTVWSRGIKPVISSLPNSVDMVSLYYDGDKFFGSFEPAFSDMPPSVSIVSVDAKTGTSSTTHTLTSVPAGALLVLTTSFGSNNENASITSTPVLTWTKRADASEDESGDAEIYTANFPAGGNISITSNWGFPYMQSSTCYVVVNQESSPGGAIQTGEGQSAPSVSITSTRANSILIGVSSDWNAINGSTRTLRSSATEANYVHAMGDVTAYHYYLAAPTVGSYTLGVSAPTGQSSGTCVIEIRGNN